MTPEERKALKLAWANGETLQGRDTDSDVWYDWDEEDGLDLTTWDLWRVKSKPVKVWVIADVIDSQIIEGAFTNKTQAEAWMRCLNAEQPEINHFVREVTTHPHER